jgi:hypothetical protein
MSKINISIMENTTNNIVITIISKNEDHPHEGIIPLEGGSSLLIFDIHSQSCINSLGSGALTSQPSFSAEEAS